jgi:predicted  nucleic acid-binding Zn-ribbon protein
MEHQQREAADIMDIIVGLQQQIAHQREAKRALEENIADIDRLIDQDMVELSQLQEELQQAIAAATHKAVGG